MLTARQCPTSDSWLSLLEDRIGEIEREELESHLDHCDGCRRVLDELSEGATVTRVLEGRPAERFDVNMIAVMGRIERRIAAEIRSENRSSAGEPPEEAVAPTIPGFENWEWIGRGGMGVVFRALQLDLNRTVAVKVLSAVAGATEAQRSRAIREALANAKVQHPNVVEIHGTGRVEGLPYLVMEYIDGGTLHELIRKGPLPERQSAEIVRDLARAVAAAHARGVVHRDLKPANVLLDRSGDKLVPKLTDFGLALCHELGAGITETGAVVGTPSYMAPEQTGLADKLGPVGPAADIHGLGAILYACVTGRAPYEGRSSWEILVKVSLASATPIRAVRPQTSADLANIVARCLERTPSRRYGGAAALADDLDRFLEGRPVTARPVGPITRGYKWMRRRPATASLVLFLLLGVAGATIAGFYHVRSLSRTLRLAVRQQERASQSLHLLTSGVVQRFADRAEFLDEDDFAFLHEIRRMLEEPPDATEPDLFYAWCSRAQNLGRLGQIFDRIGRGEDARICTRSSVNAAMQSPDSLLSRQLQLNGLAILFTRACDARDLTTARGLAEEMKEVPPLPVDDPLNEWILNSDWRLLVLEGYQKAKEGKSAEARDCFVRCRERCRADLVRYPGHAMLYHGLALSGFEILKTDLPKLSPAQVEARIKECHEEIEKAFDPSNELNCRFLAIAIEELTISTLVRGKKLEEAKKHDVERRRMGRELLDIAEHGATRGHDIEGLNGLRAIRSYLATLTAASALRPQSADLHEIESDLAEGTIKGLEAVRKYKRDPTMARAVAQILTVRARMLATGGKPREAVDLWDQGIALIRPLLASGAREEADVRYVWFNLLRTSMLRSQTGEHQDALRRATEAMDVADDHYKPQLYLRASECRLALKDYDGAKRDAESAARDSHPQIVEAAQKLLARIAAERK